MAAVTFERKVLLDALEAVAPALSQTDVVRWMTHFIFTGEHVQAYNDRIGISAPCRTNFKGALPATLLDLLKTSKAKQVSMEPNGDSVRVKVGGTNAKLAMIPELEYAGTFTIPDFAEDHKAVGNAAREALIEALRICVKGVGNDMSSPAQLGVTFVPDDERLCLYSTNNATITQATMKAAASLPIDKRVIMSTEFCEQLLRLNKRVVQNAKLHVLVKTYSLAKLGNVLLFGRLIDDKHPQDFAAIINDHCSAADRKLQVDVPAKLTPIIDRALIMTANKHEAQRTAIEVQAFDDTNHRVRFTSQGGHGVVSDYILVSKSQAQCAITVEPKLLKAGLDNDMERVLFKSSCVIMSKPGVLFLIQTVDK